jgi:hypothetical protein
MLHTSASSSRVLPDLAKYYLQQSASRMMEKGGGGKGSVTPLCEGISHKQSKVFQIEQCVRAQSTALSRGSVTRLLAVHFSLSVLTGATFNGVWQYGTD